MAPSACQRMWGILPPMVAGVEGGGKEKSSGLWWMGVSFCSGQKSKTLACSSERYHYSPLIQRSMDPLSPRRVQGVTQPQPHALHMELGDRKMGKRRFSHNCRNQVLIHQTTRLRLQPGPATATCSPCGFRRLRSGKEGILTQLQVLILLPKTVGFLFDHY